MAALLASFPQIVANFQWKDALDMIIVAFLIYGFLLLLRRTHSRVIINGISVLLGIYLVARYLNLYLTSTLFQEFFAFFVVILVVIFQRELRNFFEWISLWGTLSSAKKISLSELVTRNVADAVEKLSEQKIGALIVFPGRQIIDTFLQGGITVGGRISSPLILSIFDPSSPGHDGAVIIEGDRIKKFGVHLPLAERFERYPDIGTRHRAALGLSEHSDALIIVVSEETGAISIAHEGTLQTIAKSDELKEIISGLFEEKSRAGAPVTWHSFVTNNLREKIIACGFTLLFWYIFVVQLGSGIISRDFKIPVEFRFLPQQYAITKQSADAVTITLSGSNQDFSLLDPDKLKVIINMPNPVEGYQRIKIDEDIISHPGALPITKFSPGFIDFRITQEATNKALQQ